MTCSQQEEGLWKKVGYLRRVQEGRMKEHVEFGYSRTSYRLAADDHFGVSARKIRTEESLEEG